MVGEGRGSQREMKKARAYRTALKRQKRGSFDAGADFSEFKKNRLFPPGDKHRRVAPSEATSSDSEEGMADGVGEKDSAEGSVNSSRESSVAEVEGPESSAEPSSERTDSNVESDTDMDSQ